jgi:hypothetical protein
VVFLVVALVFSAKTQVAALRIERMKVKDFMMINAQGRLENAGGKDFNGRRQRR